MFSRGANLKYFKKLDVYKNSNGTVSYNVANGEGFSYAQKIAIVDHEKKIVIYNRHNFSVTTTQHFSGLMSLISDKIDSSYKVFSLDIDTLNGLNKSYLNKKDLNTFLDAKKDNITTTSDLSSLFDHFKLDKKILKFIVDNTIKYEKTVKEYRNKNSRIKTYYRKLENLDFKNAESFKKTYEKLQEISNFSRLIVKCTDKEKISSLRSLLNELPSKNLVNVNYEKISLSDRTLDILNEVNTLEIFDKIG